MPQVNCSMCARTSEHIVDGAAPLGWSADVEQTNAGPRTRWVCPDCTRRNVRAIEAKLDQSWW